MGTRYGTNHLSGWPIKNTRLRFALTCVVILTLILSLVPFRSRVIAYVLALYCWFALLWPYSPSHWMLKMLTLPETCHVHKIMIVSSTVTLQLVSWTFSW